MTGPETTPDTPRHSAANVLGLCSTGHGAAAALVSARHGVRALTLDRYTGCKHSLLFSRRELTDIHSGESDVDHAIRDALDYSFNGFPPSFISEDALLPFVRHLLGGLPLGPEDIDMIVTADCHFAFNWDASARCWNACSPMPRSCAAWNTTRSINGRLTCPVRSSAPPC